VDTDRLILVWPDHRSMPRNGDPQDRGVITTDDSSGVRAAVNHLIDQGSRRIAYASGGVRASNTIRAETTAATMRNRKIRAPMRSLDAAAAGPDGVGQLAAEIAADLPDAVVCYDDKLALALMDALRDIGLRVPEDVGVVGFDGIPFAAIANTRLTTVAVPTAELGRQAARLLIDAVHTGVLPDGVLLPVEIVVRESTGSRPAAKSATGRDD